MELCVIEGDGIGREVVPAAVRVLQRGIPDLNIRHARAGWECFQDTGTSLPTESFELAQSCGAVLFGACSSPSYPVEGYFSPIVRLRRLLQTYANLRPTGYLPVPTSKEGVDLIVVRENTEGLYVGQEHTTEDGNTGTATQVITRAATERIAHVAFQIARCFHRKKVTVTHKSNILPQSDGLFRRICFEVATQYSEIEIDELLIDTAAYWMVKDPTRFDILLTTNLYGDILSDMAAAWGGGLGLAPALNLGDGVAIAEPVHGSAPDIAGQNIANPVAAIMSAAMLARYHWNMPEFASAIEQAVYRTLENGAHTPDICCDASSSTIELTEQICGFL